MAATSSLRSLLRQKRIFSTSSSLFDTHVSSSSSFVNSLTRYKVAPLHPSQATLICLPLIRPYSSEVLYKSDVTVQFRDGLPVVGLPLPSRRESCEFTLKPISHTVGDFARFIKEEDGGVDTVQFYTNDGNRIAKSTTIDVLLRADFKLTINDQKYDVSPPVTCPLPSEDAATMQDVHQLVSRLYSTLHVENHQLEREAELMKRLEDLNMEIAPLDAKNKVLMEKASGHTNKLTWMGLGAMSLQFGILARLTWWEYSWDIMEPVTYFVTYGTSIGMFGYFLLTKQEYIFPDAVDRQFLLSYHKMARKQNMDVKKYNELRDSISEVSHDLRRLRDPLQMHLPIKEVAKQEHKA